MVNIKEYYITVRSVTYAQKISDMLKNIGVKPKLMRSPKNLSVGGCGYAVYIKNGDIELMKEVALSNNFRVYVSENGNEYEEIR